MKKDRHTFYLTNEVYDALVVKAKEAPGSSYGEQTRIVEEALREKLGLPTLNEKRVAKDCPEEVLNRHGIHWTNG